MTYRRCAIDSSHAGCYTAARQPHRRACEEPPYRNGPL